MSLECAFPLIQSRIDPDLQSLHESHFSPREIEELAVVVINMNVWTCLKLALGIAPFYS